MVTYISFFSINLIRQIILSTHNSISFIELLPFFGSNVTIFHFHKYANNLPYIILNDYAIDISLQLSQHFYYFSYSSWFSNFHSCGISLTFITSLKSEEIKFSKFGSQFVINYSEIAPGPTVLPFFIVIAFSTIFLSAI
jgi:hypothetical protein